MLKYYPQTIKEYEERIAGYENDAALVEQHKPQGEDIVINALNTLRTRQLQEERPTEPVDELISKVAHAPTKKVKVVHCRCNEER